MFNIRAKFLPPHTKFSCSQVISKVHISQQKWILQILISSCKPELPKKKTWLHIKCCKIPGSTWTRRQNLAEEGTDTKGKRTSATSDQACKVLLFPVPKGLFFRHRIQHQRKSHGLLAAAARTLPRAFQPVQSHAILLSYSHTTVQHAQPPTAPFLERNPSGAGCHRACLAPTGDSNLLGNPSLLLMGVMIESEGDSSVPRSLQHRVLQPPLVCAVVPLRHVRGAVGAVGRGPHLLPVHTAATLDPATRSLPCHCKAPPLFKSAAH